MDCPTSIKKIVDVESQVTIVPAIDVGDIQSCCVGKPIVLKCSDHCGCGCDDSCAYLVCQMVCVEIPIKISVSAIAALTEIECENTCKEASKHILQGKEVSPWLYKQLMRNIKRKPARDLKVSSKHFCTYKHPIRK